MSGTRRTNTPQQHADEPRISDPLAVVPRHAPGVEIRETDKGEYHLRKQYPPGRGVMAFLRRRLGWKHECHYNLDVHGTDFWKLLDGRRTLEDIAQIVAKQWEVTIEEGRRASVLYIRGLMLRNLVILEVPESARDEATT